MLYWANEWILCHKDKTREKLHSQQVVRFGGKWAEILLEEWSDYNLKPHFNGRIKEALILQSKEQTCLIIQTRVVYYIQRCYKGIYIFLTRLMCTSQTTVPVRHFTVPLTHRGAPIFRLQLTVAPDARSSVPLADPSLCFPINPNLSPLGRLPEWSPLKGIILSAEEIHSLGTVHTPHHHILLFVQPGTAP